jgi:hypothetical protein
MDDLKKYTVDVNGIPHTFLLTDAQAKTRGLKPVEEKQAPAPANKARTARNKSGGN